MSNRTGGNGGIYMRKLNRVILAISAAVLLTALFSAGFKTGAKQPGGTFQYASFRDIPGVTEDEIKAIEDMRKQVDHFTYGMISSSESFHDDNLVIRGFSALFCEWLTKLFGIPFKPEITGWNTLLGKLASNEIDFTGALTATEERRETYFMTTPIALHRVQYFRIAGSPPLESIAESRPLRYAFMQRTATIDMVVSKLAPGKFEIILASDIDAVYRMLKSGEIDAAFNLDREIAFDVYGDVVASDFSPLIYTSASLTTQNPALEPIISVVQKALDNGSLRHLAELHNTGRREYLKYRLSSELSEEERRHMKAHPVVSLAAEADNFPGSFYNTYEKQWQGFAFDVLREVEALTGLRFELVNNEKDDWHVILKMLEDGKASVLTELMQSKEREGRFLWSDTILTVNHPALVSSSDFRNISLNEILYLKIGLIKDHAYSTLFREWFPDHSNTREYANISAAINALGRGEIDAVMTITNEIMSFTNFQERTAYKVNYLFDSPLNFTFGFNRNEAVLCSIVDKALRLINTSRITDQWMRRIYNYRSQIVQSQLPWLIGASILFFSALALVAVLFARTRRAGKLIGQRTRELELKNVTLTTLFDSIPDIVFTLDKSLRFTQCNKCFLEFFGLSKEDIINRGEDGLGLSDEETQEHNKWNSRVIEEGRAFVREESISRVDGAKSLYEIVKAPLMLNGEVVGVLGIAHEITKRKEMEEMALAASRAKGIFLAQMSHEIRTPLNAIIGMSYVLKDCLADNEEALHSANQIMTSSRHLLGILNDILDMSKIESGKLELTHEPFSLLTALGEAADIMRHRCVEKNIALVTNMHEIKDIVLTGDKLRLDQILINLLGNAVKFTGANGEIRFFTEITGESAEKAEVKFSISDNGIGMSEEQVKKLFVPFEQTDSTIAARFGGTGLGLSISQNIVNMMGGSISVESEPGRGSRFEFSLSFDKGRPEAARAADEKDEALDLNGKRMLLAEDMEINRLVVRKLLSRFGLATDEAENGQQAVDAFSGSPEGYYDLIMMDIHMPVMDGYEAAKAIRALDRADAKTVPIIAMTASAYKEDVEQALAAGMNGHLAKPIDKSALMKTVGTMIKA